MQSPSSYINNPVSGTQYWSKLWTGVVAASGDLIDANVKVWSGINGTGSLLSVTSLQVWNWHYLGASMSTFSGGPFNFAHTQHTVTGGEAGFYTQVSAKFTGAQTPGSFELYLIYTTSQQFLPAVPTFAPAVGGPGTAVVITGSRFTDAGGVWFNVTGDPGFVVDSDTQITAHVPAGATYGPVQVGNPVGNVQSVGSFTPSTFRVDDGAAWQTATLVHGDDGAAWQTCKVWADDGTSWQQIA